MNEILQNLVILQDLDDVISEAQNAELLSQQEKMGFEIKGLEKLKEARQELMKKIPLLELSISRYRLNLRSSRNHYRCYL